MVEIRRLLCPVDLSEFSRHALDHAAGLARRYGGHVTALHVFAHWPAVDAIPSLGSRPISAESLDEASRAALMAALRTFVDPAAQGIKLDAVLAEAPDVSREILMQAEALEPDLLVIGSHGRSGFERLLLGSVTEKVVRKAACPVMVVPSRAPDVDPRAPIRFARLLCPVDGSGASAHALAYGLRLAEETGARIALLHVVEMPPELQEVPASSTLTFDGLREAAKSEWKRRLAGMVQTVPAHCNIDILVVEGRAQHEIARLAVERRADLIVMGAQGRHAIERWPFGSNTQHVLRVSACPVLTVREA